MWSRAQLKAKAKYTFKLNYWKVVVVTFLFAIIAGGIGSNINYEFSSMGEDIFQIPDDFENDGYGEGYFDSGSWYDDSGFEFEDDYQFYYEATDIPMLDEGSAGMVVIIVIVVLIMVLLIMVVGIAIGLVWAGFISNPITVGANRFFFKSLNEKAEVKELLYSFDNNYKNVAMVMFYRSLYQILWTLLFIIPGIVKSYEYRMIPYLLAENPNLTKEQAFSISKQMMDGQKWDAFVLDLSFIGWELLSGLTAGILGIFYVNPYIQMTNAALYEELSLMHGRPALAAASMNMGNPYQNMNPYGQVTPEPQAEMEQPAEINIDININREEP